MKLNIINMNQKIITTYGNKTIWLIIIAANVTTFIFVSIIKYYTFWGWGLNKGLLHVRNMLG